MRYTFLIVIIFSGFYSIFSQTYFDKKNGSEVVLSLLKKYKGKEIGFFSNLKFNEDLEKHNLFLIKDKSSKLWGVMKSKEWDSNEFEYLVAPVYDSIGDMLGETNFVVFKKEDHYGIASIEWDKLSIKVDCKYDIIKNIEEGESHTLVNKKGKWGLFQVAYDFLSVPCVYQNEQDVPLYELSLYDYQTYIEYKEKLAIVGYRPDGNGDGVFYGCDKEGKWGLFQMDNNIVPMKYNNIEPMSFNAPFLIVYDDNKAGIYSSPFGDCKMTVSCKYDELKRFKSNGYFYCAARKKAKWGIIDWYTGKELTEFVWDSFNDIRVSRGSLSKFYNN